MSNTFNKAILPQIFGSVKFSGKTLFLIKKASIFVYGFLLRIKIMFMVTTSALKNMNFQTKRKNPDASQPGHLNLDVWIFGASFVALQVSVNTRPWA